jgi:phage terminase Nu1 subunit (DNA packaging protein)
MTLSGMTMLGPLAGAGLGQGENKQAERKEPDGEGPKEIRDRMEEFKAFGERMRNASPEERVRLMQEQRVQQQQKAIEDLKAQLEISDKEWAVVKPRVEKVYNLVHPLSQMGMGNEQPKTEVDKTSSELRELLRDESASADQIKAKLAALRAAKQKAAQELVTARQSLRQLMTLRQEALLVLNGLLD